MGARLDATLRDQADGVIQECGKTPGIVEIHLHRRQIPVVDTEYAGVLGGRADQFPHAHEHREIVDFQQHVVQYG